MITAVMRRRGAIEDIDPTALRATRDRLGAGVRALVVDLDKCLIRGYAGVPAFRELVRMGRATWWDVAIYVALALRLRWSRARWGRALPAGWRLDGRSFQERSLRFELRTDEDSLRAAVAAALPRVLGNVRTPVMELCQVARAAGAELVLATANSMTFAEPVARALGFQTVLASRLERETGHVSELLVGERKARAVIEHLDRRGIGLGDAWLVVDLDYTGNDLELIRRFNGRSTVLVKSGSERLLTGVSLEGAAPILGAARDDGG